MNMFAREMDTTAQASVLVLSRNPKLVDAIERALIQSPELSVASETLSLAEIGEAGGLFVTNRVVVFEANPEDELELHKLKEILSARSEDNVVVALTKNDLSLQKARDLLDVGVDHVLPFSIKGDKFRALLRKELQETTPPAPVPEAETAPRSSVIAVTKSRGGVGATTVAVNLALGLAKLPGTPRVALVDLDMQFGNAGVFLDLEDNGGMQQLAEATELPDAHFMHGILQRHASGLDVLCAPASIMPLQSFSAEMVEHLINLLSAEYEYVVFDLPQALVDWVEPVLSRAARLEVVMDTSVPCVRQVRRLLDFLEYEHFRPRVDLIVNRESKPMFRSEALKQAQTILGRDIEYWLPDAPDIARKAVDLGRPAVASKPGSGLGRSFVRMAKTVQQGAPNAPKTKNEERV
ncbi:MAG: AAA family ATPase [Dinoroseobacter sp.]|nr:AAA family ATPase [Dinoroseobacter sp.]